MVGSSHGASTCKCLLQWDIFTTAKLSLTRPTWDSFDMSEFIFLCTQLEKANYKTNQPEARKPFGLISEAPNFGGGEPMTIEALGLHLAYLAAFGIFGQNWPCSNWKMENDSLMEP